MAKNTGPHDMTLLDEFEQNVGKIVEILKSSLTMIAQWNEYLRKGDQRFVAKRAVDGVIKTAESFSPLTDAFRQILRFLTIHIPEYKADVEDGRSNIFRKIREIVHKYSQEPEAVLTDQAKAWVGAIFSDMSELRGYVETLSEDLQYCVRKAGEQQQPQVKAGQGEPIAIPPKSATEEIRHDPKKTIMSEYRDRLLKAGIETHKLIAEHRHAFTTKAHKFMDLFGQWREAVVEGQREALAHLKPKLAFHSGEDIPKRFRLPKGYEHYKLYYLGDVCYNARERLEPHPLKEHNDKFPYKGKDKEANVTKRCYYYYGPPLPLNPMDTLRLIDWPVLPWDGGSGLYVVEPRDPEEDLLRKFFLLAVIHAFYSHGQPIIDRDSLAAQLVNEGYQDSDDYCVPEKQSLIETALFDVRAYLAQSKKDVQVENYLQSKLPEADSDRGNMSKADTLNEIANKLYIWRESVPGDKENPGNWIASKLSKSGQDVALKSLRLLRENADLLRKCEITYGCKDLERQSTEVLHCLFGILSNLHQNRPQIEDYINWGNEIALPGFIAELRRWAERLKEEGASETNSKTPSPIETQGRWECKSLDKLRQIDSSPTRKGIEGNKKDLKYLRDYVKRRLKRPDIAKSLYHDDGRIKTTMPCRSMFNEK